MGLYDKAMDKLHNKISGTNTETINMDLGQFLKLLDKEFLSKIKDDSEYDEISMLVKGKMFKALQMISKDGRYELRSFIDNGVGVLDANHRYVIWIREISTDRRFQYNAYFSGSIKKSVAKRIADYRSGIAETKSIEVVEENSRDIDVSRPICPDCGAELPDGARFCLKCGAAIPEKPQAKVCDNCGSKILDGAKFCLKCGKPITEGPQVRSCVNCGAELLEGAAFCMKCGTKAE